VGQARPRAERTRSPNEAYPSAAADPCAGSLPYIRKLSIEEKCFKLGILVNPSLFFSGVSGACHSARVAIDGAQSTGKTTVFHHLRNTLPGRTKFIPEASREVAGRFGVVGASDWPGLIADQRRLREFFEAEEAFQRLAEGGCGAFVVDSSLYLIRAYREYFGVPPLPGECGEFTYDLILYCPAIQCGVEDGFRFLAGRADVDRLCRDTLRRCHRGQLIELPPDESRLLRAEEAVLGCLKRWGQGGVVGNGAL